MRKVIRIITLIAALDLPNAPFARIFLDEKNIEFTHFDHIKIQVMMAANTSARAKTTKAEIIAAPPRRWQAGLDSALSDRP
jgi:hypothetical protein